MKFTAYTTGNVPATEENIRFAFLHEETADSIGNVYRLENDGKFLIAISGKDFGNFSLSYKDAAYPTIIRIKESLSAQQTLDHFLKFLAGEKDWLNDLRPEKINNSINLYSLIVFIVVLITLLFFVFIV